MTHAPRIVLLVAIALVITGVSLTAGIKVKVQEDKTFDFTGLRTFAWKLDPNGTIKILQNTGDDPVQIRANLEPTVMAAVERELAKKGFTKATSGTPDLLLDYYLLVGPNIQSQYQGQFVGAVPAWGLPDFAMSATSYKAFEQGSLVVDVMSAREQQIVWRVVAEAGIDRQRTAAQREKLISDAATEMFKKFPPKFKK
jgi:Domain of unknown function (DUF4136)